jgi:hypothetical protein
MVNDLPPLPQASAALEKEKVTAAWNKATKAPTKDCLRLLKEAEDAEREFGYAFGLDTKDRNDPETCRNVVRSTDPQIRGWVNDYRVKVGLPII